MSRMSSSIFLYSVFILSWPPDKLLPSVGFRSLARRRFRFGCVSFILSDICLLIFLNFIMQYISTRKFFSIAIAAFFRARQHPLREQNSVMTETMCISYWGVRQVTVHVSM